MRPITLTLLLTLTACAGTTPHVSWPAVVACGDTVRDDLIGTVQGVLLSGDTSTRSIGQAATDELEQLAVQHGASVIACLVSQAVHAFDSIGSTRARGLPGMTAEPTPEATIAPVAAARGRDFLQRVAGTHVEGSDQ